MSDSPSQRSPNELGDTGDYFQFIEDEYRRLFLTATCPKCKKDLDKELPRFTYRRGDVVEILCPHCPAEPPRKA